MICIKCKADKVAEGSHDIHHLGPVCGSCLLKIIEKRVRKELRVNKLIRKDDRILLIDDGSEEYLVAKYLLQSIIKGLPVTFFSRRFDLDRQKLPVFLKEKQLSDAIKKDRITRVILPWNLDDECVLFLKQFFSGKSHRSAGQDALYVKPLINILGSEVSAFAKIRKLKTAKSSQARKAKTAKTPKRSSLYLMLDEFERKYPETKFSILSSIEELSSLRKK